MWEIAETEKVEHSGKHRLAREWLINDDGTLSPNGDFQKKWSENWTDNVIDFTEERYQKLLGFRKAIIALYDKLDEVLGDKKELVLAAMLDGKKLLTSALDL